jgi:creatinine amidohydrolase
LTQKRKGGARMRLDEITTTEFVAKMKENPIVFLPMGATEAHGMHLPLGTDSFQPEALCERLAEEFDGLLAPPIRYGHHSSTRYMPGTIALRYDTVRAVVTDILESLVRNGVDKVVLVSGHAGSLHLAAIKDAAEEAVRGSALHLMVLTDYDIAYKFPLPSNPEYPDGHGGLIETSRVLAVRPDLVRSKRPKGKFMDKDFMVVADPETCMPMGMVGDATLATADLGKEIDDFIFERLSALIHKNFGV